jgi:uroporphyrinogen-III synthase
LLPLTSADAILFTSAMSYKKAVWDSHNGLLLMAIGEITGAAMEAGGHTPAVVGDGSLEGSLSALNQYLAGKENRT